MDQNFKVNVDESFMYDLKNSDIEELDVIKLSSSKFHLINNNKSFKINIEKSDFNNKKYVIKLNENSYTVKISNELDSLIKEMGFSAGSGKKLNEIKNKKKRYLYSNALKFISSIRYIPSKLLASRACLCFYLIVKYKKNNLTQFRLHSLIQLFYWIVFWRCCFYIY